jgi:hypothetical protein
MKARSFQKPSSSSGNICLPVCLSVSISLQTVTWNALHFDHARICISRHHLLITSCCSHRYPPGTVQEYCAQVTFNCYVDARDPEKSGIARYMNHSSQPNVTKRTRISGQKRSIRCYALTDICEGEELVWDYGAHYWADRSDMVQS